MVYFFEFEYILLLSSLQAPQKRKTVGASFRIQNQKCVQRSVAKEELEASY